MRNTSASPQWGRSNRSCHKALRLSSGAAAFRVSDAAHVNVNEHSHDWPVLSLYISGAVRNLTAAGETVLCGPSAVLYSAGAEHANVVSAHGFEQIQIEFDPGWLRLDEPQDLDGAHHWVGGEVALAAGALAALWVNAETSDTELAGATSRFLQKALRCEETKTPVWLEHVLGMLAADNPPPTREIASELGLNPRWLCQAYRAAIGEGIGDTVRRRKVEVASELLRSTTLPPSQIAAEAGFSDQSHMIRCFNAVLRCTPGAIKRQWQTPEL